MNTMPQRYPTPASVFLILWLPQNLLSRIFNSPLSPQKKQKNKKPPKIVYFKGKIPSTGKILPRGGSNPQRASSRTVSPTHYQWAIPAPCTIHSQNVTTIFPSLLSDNNWYVSLLINFSYFWVGFQPIASIAYNLLEALLPFRGFPTRMMYLKHDI